MTEPPSPALPPAPSIATSSPTRVAIHVLLIVGAVALGLWALHRLASVLVLVTLAALFAYVIAPLVHLAERPIRLAGRRRHLPRGLAIALVYVVLAGSASFAAVLLLPIASEQAHEMIARAPSYAQSLTAWQHGWSRYYERLRIPAGLRQGIDQSMVAAGETAVESTRTTVIALVVAVLPWIVLIPVLAFFLLRDATALRRLVVTALPYRIRLRGHRLFEEANATLAAYIRAQLLACVLVGSLCGVGFAVMGFPYPVLLGVLAGALESIPLVGPLVVALAVATVGALHAPMLAVSAVAFLAVLRILEDYVVYPRLMRRGVQLHPLAVILGILAGAELDGVAGMFLAVPVTAIGSVLFRHWIGWRSDDAAEATSSSEPAPVQFSTA
jgi:predicted PurR-regulated permease PerM